jgi:hypothetical protein
MISIHYLGYVADGCVQAVFAYTVRQMNDAGRAGRSEYIGPGALEVFYLPVKHFTRKVIV